MHEVANGLLAAGAADGVELALLPRGTGKDFVRSLRIPTKLGAAIDVARDGSARTVDVGRASYRAWDGSEAEAYFVNFAGAGISGAIARRANTASKVLGGHISFLSATVAVFARWTSEPVTADIDGEQRSGAMFEVLAMNGDYTGGGMLMAPDAELDDGQFDVVLIGDVTKVDFVRTFPKIYRGKHLSHPKIDVLRGRNVAVESQTPLPIVLDGEQPGTTPVRFELVPQALTLRVPSAE